MTSALRHLRQAQASGDLLHVLRQAEVVAAGRAHGPPLCRRRLAGRPTAGSAAAPEVLVWGAGAAPPLGAGAGAARLREPEPDAGARGGRLACCLPRRHGVGRLAPPPRFPSRRR